VSDFPPELECLFQVPDAVQDEALRSAVGQLAATMKEDLIVIGAPVEIVMEASAALVQYAKHMEATRHPYGFPEEGGYTDPGAERAAMSSVNSTITAYREAMSKLRVVRANPAQLQAAREERDEKFKRCVQQLMQKAARTEVPVCGQDLLFWVQSELFPLLQEEGLQE
jgi:hypothetical protein